MGTDSAIAWTDHTWNCWQGCTKVSAGCANCYMYREKVRWGQDPANVVRSAASTFRAPLAHSRDGWKWAPGSKVFACSWSDWFHEAADPWRDEAWAIVRERVDLNFLILTKRVERIEAHLPPGWGYGWPNVWLGATVEDDSVGTRVAALQAVPARHRFLSLEPVLGPIDLVYHAFDGCGLGSMPGIYWVIVGGESGPGARYADPDWMRDLRDQCARAKVPFFCKQMSGGATIPDDLLIRQFPPGLSAT